MYDFFIDIDIDLIAMIILLIVLSSFLRQRKRDFINKKILIYLISSNILMLFLEIILKYIKIYPQAVTRGQYYFIFYIYIFLSTLPVIYFTIYLDYRVFFDQEGLIKRSYYYTIPSIITVIMLIMNHFGKYKNFVFFIDQNNMYFRGLGVPIIVFVNALLMIYSIVLTFKESKNLSKRIRKSIIYADILPLLVVSYQVLYCGIIYIWSFFALGILILYINIELKAVSKDYLTNVYNRKFVDEYIIYKIKTTTKDNLFAVIMIDLDEFKNINDIYGHDEGDQALIITASILKNSVKSTDVVARFAGDEFLIVLDIDQIKTLKKIIKRIKDNFEGFNHRNNKPYKIKYSLGASIFNPKKHKNNEDIVKDVDKKMYKQKEEHKTFNKNSKMNIEDEKDI
ncbi:MAG: diguanylate cyclase [Peptostreptococcaceae bacterium]|jgi:diguanylate cyclase (GGDEF)-like protein|nr:diguanylate cyclase [Peptostreptococcaceae bacterium]